MADTSPLQPNFIRDLKFSAGSTAIITFGGIAAAFLAVFIVWIVHHNDATFNVLGCVALLVSAFVIVAMLRLPSEFSMSLMGYALVSAAVFLGFIYDAENAMPFGIPFESWIVRLISVGLISVACMLQFPRLVKIIKLVMYAMVPIVILGILAHYEFIPNWLFALLTVIIIVFVAGLITLFYTSAA